MRCSEPRLMVAKEASPLDRERLMSSQSLLRFLILGGSLVGLLALTNTHRLPLSESPEARLTRGYRAQVSGGAAPDFMVELQRPTPGSVLSAAGRPTLKLSALKGQVVMLNFWASWCPPCVEELPDLELIAAEMKGRPFKLLAVSVDEGWEEIERLVGSRPLSMLVARDPAKRLHNRYGTRQLPETYIIDKDGQLRLRFIALPPWAKRDREGQRELDQRIIAYLKSLTEE